MNVAIMLSKKPKSVTTKRYVSLRNIFQLIFLITKNLAKKFSAGKIESRIKNENQEKLKTMENKTFSA